MLSTLILSTFEQRSLSLFIRRPTMGKTIGEPDWSVGVSAVKTLRNGDPNIRRTILLRGRVVKGVGHLDHV